jgi:hypothetical protein
VPSLNKPLPQDVLGRIDRDRHVEHGAQPGPRRLIQQQVVAFDDQSAHGARYRARGCARNFEIAVKHRDRDLILVVALEAIEHVEQTEHVEGFGGSLAGTRAALDQDAVVVMIPVHRQQRCGTLRALIQASY